MGLFGNINLKDVQWAPTVQLHLTRAAAAGIVWMWVGLLSGAGAPALLFPFAAPLFYLIGMPMYLAVGRVMASLIGEYGPVVLGLMTFMFAVGIVVGDPMVSFLHHKRPDLVPVETFAPINFVVVLFVSAPVDQYARI